MVRNLSYWQLQSQIDLRQFSPVYLFAGEEDFLKRQVQESIKKYLFSQNSLPFNYDLFYAEDAGFEAVLDVIRTQPFLSEKRLVVIKNLEKFSPYEKPLLNFLKNPFSKTILILETQKNINDKFIKKLTAYLTVVEFCPLQGQDLIRWINKHVHSCKRKISHDAVILLIEKVGNELGIVLSVLNKLCLYVDQEKMITEEDVETLVEKTKEETRFAFLDALTTKQTSRALLMANELTRGGKNITDIIGLINWQLKRIERVKGLTIEGYSQQDIAGMLNLSTYVIGIINKQAALFTKGALEKGFALLLESDLAIKQGLKNPCLVLEMLIVRLCANI